MRPVYLEGFDGFVTSTAAPIATGWSDLLAGWELHPLKIHTLSTAHSSRVPVSVPRPDEMLLMRRYSELQDRAKKCAKQKR